jgi:hypothetical protein
MRHTSTCSGIILLELNTRQSNLVIIRVMQQKRIETIVQQFKKSTTLLTISYDSQQTTKRTKTSFWIVRRVWKYQRCYHVIWSWKSRSWFWTGTKIWRFNRTAFKTCRLLQWNSSSTDNMFLLKLSVNITGKINLFLQNYSFKLISFLENVNCRSSRLFSSPCCFDAWCEYLC